jgi:valyl-tRNA synthetase
MPFITEELWRVTAETGPKRDTPLVLASWPKHDGLDNADADAEIGWLIDLVTAIRSVRVEMNIPADADPGGAGGASAETRRAPAAGGVRQAARARRRYHFADAPPQGSVQLLDSRRGRGAAAQGRDRLRRRARAAQQGNAEGRIRHQRVDAKLGNPKFVANAPRRSSKASARSARRRRTAARRSSRRWSGCKRQMSAPMSAYEFGVSERRTFEERLTARWLRRPFTDAEGRKRLYKFFARAQPHVVRHYARSLPGWPRFERPLRIALLATCMSARTPTT